ncbi:MAG: hypothetical protein PUP90_16335 [Nostoc sp. S4]|nr:hypothetical protein [Nostoc sp. S4]
MRNGEDEPDEGNGQWGENFHLTSLPFPHSLFAPYPMPNEDIQWV